MQLRLNKTDWSNFTETNDDSYAPAGRRLRRLHQDHRLPRRDPALGDGTRLGRAPFGPRTAEDLLADRADRAGDPVEPGPELGRQPVALRGALAVNPNTMYPLLRSLEAQGLAAGEWEHPERRSRRFYRITDAGRQEHARLAAEIGPRLDRIARSIDAIRGEVLG